MRRTFRNSRPSWTCSPARHCRATSSSRWALEISGRSPMNWFSGLEGICRRDVPLAEHTWYGLGGPARWFFTPQSEDELGAVLCRCAQHAIPWHVLGRGANVLVRDEGFAGAVIKLGWDA